MYTVHIEETGSTRTDAGFSILRDNDDTDGITVATLDTASVEALAQQMKAATHTVSGNLAVMNIAIQQLTQQETT